MTTIAYRGGVLAADSQENVRNCKSSYSVPKVWKLDDERLVAGCGHEAEIAHAVRRLQSGASYYTLGLENSQLIVVTPLNLVICENNSYFELDKVEFAAWGTGATAALGALHAGASAIEAVQIAILVDPSSGGLVQYVTERKKSWWDFGK